MAQRYRIKGEWLLPKEIEERYGVRWKSLYSRMWLHEESADEALENMKEYIASRTRKPKVKAEKPKKPERKPWREMTNEEITKIKAKKCRYCVYVAGTLLNAGFGALTCDYIGKTGHRRGCDPRDCEFWRDEKPRGKRQSDW